MSHQLWTTLKPAPLPSKLEKEKKTEFATHLKRNRQTQQPLHQHTHRGTDPGRVAQAICQLNSILAKKEERMGMGMEMGCYGMGSYGMDRRK